MNRIVAAFVNGLAHTFRENPVRCIVAMLVCGFLGLEVIFQLAGGSFLAILVSMFVRADGRALHSAFRTGHELTGEPTGLLNIIGWTVFLIGGPVWVLRKLMGLGGGGGNQQGGGRRGRGGR